MYNLMMAYRLHTLVLGQVIVGIVLEILPGMSVYQTHVLQLAQRQVGFIFFCSNFNGL